MEDKYALISTLVAAIVLAFVFGFIASRIRLSPIVGYLLAGLAVGPHTPGFTGNTELAYSFAGKTLGKIRLIPDATITRHAGKIAIIIDDFGYTMNETVKALMKLDIPLTYSVIPGVKFSKEIAARLQQNGKAIMLHLPMQALERQVEKDGYSLMLDMKPP